jgi:pilus assembly protein CpaC
MRRTTLLLASAVLLTASAAAEDAVVVTAGSQRIVGFEKPVATLYIADPTVVDAKALDKQHVSIIGKARGTTSILAADGSGATIAIGRVVVTDGHVRGARGAAEGATVMLQRGGERVLYSCGDALCRATQRSGSATNEGGHAAAPAAAGTVQQITITSPVPQAAASADASAAKKITPQ